MVKKKLSQPYHSLGLWEATTQVLGSVAQGAWQLEDLPFGTCHLGRAIF